MALTFAGLVAGPGVSHAATQGPCDIYAAGNTPCVAAHSTTRALYGSYGGPLYQVRRSSDNATRDIVMLSAGGYANAAAQDGAVLLLGADVVGQAGQRAGGVAGDSVGGRSAHAGVAGPGDRRRAAGRRRRRAERGLPLVSRRRRRRHGRG